MAKIEIQTKKWTKKELVDKLNQQQEKLNEAIYTLIDYASKGFNKKPALKCLEKIGVERIEYTYEGGLQ